MSDFTARLKQFGANFKKNSYVKLSRGENRKNNLRKSRRVCLIVFASVAAIMCLLYTTISSMTFSITGKTSKVINKAEVQAELNLINAEIADMEAADISDYAVADSVTHNNKLENLQRSVLTLTELLNGNYDGKEYSVVYVDASGQVNSFGSHSWSYDTTYRSYVLDFLTMLIAIFCSVTVANVFGAEYGEKTAKLMFTKPSTRVKLYLCKMAVVIKECLLYCTIGFIILLLVNWGDTGFDFKPLLTYFDGGVKTVSVFEQIVGCYFNIFVTSLFYTTLAVLLCVAAKSRVLPIFGVILFSRLGEIEAIKSLMRETADSSMALYNIIFTNHVNLGQYLSMQQTVVAGTSYTISVLVLLAYIVVLFVSSLLSFKKQKIMK